MNSYFCLPHKLACGSGHKAVHLEHLATTIMGVNSFGDIQHGVRVLINDVVITEEAFPVVFNFRGVQQELLV